MTQGQNGLQGLFETSRSRKDEDEETQETFVEYTFSRDCVIRFPRETLRVHISSSPSHREDP